MKDINYYKKQIQSKRKQTSFRDFLLDIASWYPLMLNNRGSLSRYPDTKRSPRLISAERFSENIDTNSRFGTDFDFNKTFFENLEMLFKKVPLPYIHEFRTDSENSDYADVLSSSKNVYLSFNVTRGNENILYSLGVKENGKNILNSIMVWDNSEIIFNSHGIISSHTVYYSKFIYNSNHIWFSSNLLGCSDCLFCDNLQNKSFYIHNKKYAEKDYFLEKQKILKNKHKFEEYFNNISNLGKNLGSTQNIEGIFVINSQSIDKGIFCYNVKEAKNIILSGYSYGLENIYDTMFCGAKKDCYGTLCCGLQAENIYNSFGISGGMNIYYSYNLVGGCSYCLGCIGLKNKSYCIFKKQYSKEEWNKKASEIFEKMEGDGILGDFFPARMNPFYFNDTMAGVLGKFSKEEVLEKGYMWRDEKVKVDILDGSDVIMVEKVRNKKVGNECIRSLQDFEGFDENGNWKINPEILKKVIKTDSGDYYRIVQMEYDFLLKHRLPLPRLHWLERMKLNFGIK